MSTPHDHNPDPMTVALIAELHMLEDLLMRGCLTDAGLDHGYRFCVAPANVVPGNASIIRERVLAEFITALAAAHGIPEAYWTDRTEVDVPDDPSSLGDPPKEQP